MNFATKFVLFVAILVVCLAPSETRELGSKRSVLATQNVDWMTMKYPPLPAKVGDKITFTWSGLHSLYKIPSGSCPSAFTDGANGVSKLAGASDGGTFTVDITAPGKTWYACSVPGHCAAGQLLTVDATA